MTMNRSKLVATLFTVLQLTVLGCAGPRAAAPEQSTLLALGPTTGLTPSGETAPLVQRRLPAEMVHDPAARFALTEQLRTQIVARTRGDSDARYWNEVRPRLRRQVEDAGLPRADVELLFWEVDQARLARR
jgi:hypothetical protein